MANFFQVIKSTNRNETELELYPITLRIIRHQAQSTINNRMAYPQSNSWSGMAGGYGAAALSKDHFITIKKDYHSFFPF